MSSTTTKGLPVPDDTDLIAQGAAAIRGLGNALDFTYAQQLDGSKVTAATPIANYPLGLSVLVLTGANAAAGGWPSGYSSSVYTLKFNADRMVQWWYQNGSAVNQRVMYRTVTSGTWLPWATVTTGPAAVGNGNVDVSKSPTDNVTVTLPAGLFTAAPAVVAVSSSNSWFVAVGSVSTTSFTVSARNWNNTPGSGQLGFRYIALGTT